jgi:hypothetical protein
MEPDQELHSFPYEAVIGGAAHFYRITENQGRFGIEQDGVFIATVEKEAGKWKQVSGKSISSELLKSICVHIESHYNYIIITNSKHK